MVPGGSMSWVVGFPSNSYKPITNTAWVRARFSKLQKGCTPLAAASDQVYQLHAHCRWFSPGTPASSTTKFGCHDIAEILLKVTLNTKIKIFIKSKEKMFFFIWLIINFNMLLLPRRFMNRDKIRYCFIFICQLLQSFISIYQATTEKSISLYLTNHKPDLPHPIKKQIVLSMPKNANLAIRKH